jgi:hypothetical protein
MTTHHHHEWHERHNAQHFVYTKSSGSLREVVG